MNIAKNCSETYTFREYDVPFYICFILIVFHLLFGVLFNSLRGDHSFISASYSCFAMLFTIGFGDFVEGNLLNIFEVLFSG